LFLSVAVFETRVQGEAGELVVVVRRTKLGLRACYAMGCFACGYSVLIETDLGELGLVVELFAVGLSGSEVGYFG